MTHTDIINELIRLHDYQSYAEIGVQNPINNFDKINVPYKRGCDPEPLTVWKLTGSKQGSTFKKPKKDNRQFYSTRINLWVTSSDDFFARLDRNLDIFFIDGLHHAEQVYKDICNASKHLTPGGCIVVDDLNPATEKMQRVPRETKVWTGDCWRAWVALPDDLEKFVIDIPYGVGVMYPQKPIENNYVDLNYSFKDFFNNRQELLNLTSVTQWKTRNKRIL